MKTLFNYPVPIYIIATIACICIMVIIDYVLGAEAEHLNAWVIVNRLFGRETGLMMNTIFGLVLIQMIKLFIRVVHS